MLTFVIWGLLGVGIFVISIIFVLLLIWGIFWVLVWSQTFLENTIGLSDQEQRDLTLWEFMKLVLNHLRKWLLKHLWH